jgi:phage baseplate assembly protein W
MAKINLDILRKRQERPPQSIFTDLKLDLSLNYTSRDELLKTENIADVKVSNNVDAIKNSIISLLTTSPGEKILNPEFGINFGDLLFLPVTEFRAQLIGENMLNQIEKYEPRITVTQLGIEADSEEDTYNIDIGFSVPQFAGENFSIRGRLNQSGFITANNYGSSLPEATGGGSTGIAGGASASIGGGY